MENKSFIEKLLNIWEKIPGLLRLVIIYLLLNGIIYGAQELYYYKDTQKMNHLLSERTNLDKEIVNLESFATDSGLSEPYYSQYKNDIDQYNQKTDEYNVLAEKSGSRWWLIPIPIGRGSKSIK